MPAKRKGRRRDDVPRAFVKKLWEKMPEIIERHQKATALRTDYIARKEALQHVGNYHSILSHITSHMQPSALREREGRRASELADHVYRQYYGTAPLVGKGTG